MFTGIVQELAEVVAIEQEPGLVRLCVALSDERRGGLQSGASVAVNGVCLTVARFETAGIGFDVIPETLERSNLGTLQVGDRVNVERSATFADEIGGHRVSGHITAAAAITHIDAGPASWVVTFAGDAAWMRYLFYKGFVAIDGASLTLSAVDRADSSFQVSLIPETLQRTTLGFRQVGERVNIEVDSQTQAVVETVERVLADPAWRADV